MIKLIQLTHTSYLVTCPDDGFYEIGTIRQARRSLSFLGVPVKETDMALDEMETKGHDLAEFGIHGMFVYTDNKGRMAGAA
jgi:hypothetical protein